jgi:hypothetical protein
LLYTADWFVNMQDERKGLTRKREADDAHTQTAPDKLAKEQ